MRVLCPLAGGDVHRPGVEGRAEAAPPFVTPSGQAGDARRCRVRPAVHARHGSHRHLLHTPIQRPLQDTGARCDHGNIRKWLLNVAFSVSEVAVIFMSRDWKRW